MYQINVYQKHIHGLDVLSSHPIESEMDMHEFRHHAYRYVFDGNPIIVEIIINADKEYAQIAKIKIVWNAKMLWNAIKTYFDRRAAAFGYCEVFNDNED